MNPAIDKNTTVEQVQPDVKLRCGPPSREPGGGGINVARVVQRLGGAPTAYFVGGGPTADILEHLLHTEDVPCERIPSEGGTRENIIVFEEQSGQQFRFGMPGPEVSEDEWHAVLDVLRGIDPSPAYLVASGSLPPGAPDDFYARVAQVARETDVRLVVDTSGDALRQAVEAGVFLIKPNVGELQTLADAPLTHEAQQEAFARTLIDRGGCEGVVLSLGAGGALLVTAADTRHVRTPTVPIRSKVGAGDSMVGGIVVALARGMALPDAVRFGVAAGAAAVMTAGTELCRREDVESLVERMRSSSA